MTFFFLCLLLLLLFRPFRIYANFQKVKHHTFRNWLTQFDENRFWWRFLWAHTVHCHLIWLLNTFLFLFFFIYSLIRSLFFLICCIILFSLWFCLSYVHFLFLSPLTHRQIESLAYIFENVSSINPLSLVLSWRMIEQIINRPRCKTVLFFVMACDWLIKIGWDSNHQNVCYYQLSYIVWSYSIKMLWQPVFKYKYSNEYREKKMEHI